MALIIGRASAAAAIGHHEIRVPVAVKIRERDRGRPETAGGIRHYRLEGAISFAQQHAYCPEHRAGCIPAGVHDHQVELAIPVYIGDFRWSGCHHAPVFVDRPGSEGSVAIAQQNRNFTLGSQRAGAAPGYHQIRFAVLIQVGDRQRQLRNKPSAVAVRCLKGPVAVAQPDRNSVESFERSQHQIKLSISIEIGKRPCGNSAGKVFPQSRDHLRQKDQSASSDRGIVE